MAQTLQKLSNLLKISVFLYVVSCIYGVEGSTCGPGECSTPYVFGGGTPSFSPDFTCYANGSIVNVSCSGILYGQPEPLCIGISYDPPYFPTCEEYYCPDPISPDHGFEIDSLDEYVLYDVASFSCDDGFILGGSQSVMCSGSGEWVPSVPSCHENCTIPFVENGDAKEFQGNTSFAPGTSLHHQEQVSVSCDSDFSLFGVDSVTCRDGVWNPPIGQCLNKCSSPIIPNSNHAVNQGLVDHGSYVVVVCDSGYTFGSGSDYPSPLTCNNGTWDTSLVCYANCPRPVFPMNPESMLITPGPRVDQSHFHNDIITVSCAPNYVNTHGPPSTDMTCDDGYWKSSTPLPICALQNDS